jgi:RND family efflux transporter MFP subunit
VKKIIVSIIFISSMLFAEGLTFSGNVISDNQKMITSRYMGFVTQLYVAAGDHVKKGQVLYKIDSRDINLAVNQVKLAIDQAQLSLQMYQSKYANVELNLARHRRLLAQNMVSKYDVENLALAASNLKDMIGIAQKQLEQAKVRLQEVQSQYKYLNIKAPNSGVIIKNNIRVGEMAMPGMPAMVLSDLQDLKIVVDVAESDLKHIHIGKKVIVNIPSIEINTVGVITAIIPNSNPMTHSFKIKITFKNRYQRIYPGMYATISID